MKRSQVKMTVEERLRHKIIDRLKEQKELAEAGLNGEPLAHVAFWLQACGFPIDNLHYKLDNTESNLLPIRRFVDRACYGLAIFMGGEP